MGLVFRTETFYGIVVVVADVVIPEAQTKYIADVVIVVNY